MPLITTGRRKAKSNRRVEMSVRGKAEVDTLFTRCEDWAAGVSEYNFYAVREVPKNRLNWTKD